MARKTATRNAQGTGTIRWRSDGRWEARFTVGIDPGTGKQIQKSVYGATQQDVRRKLTEKLREVDTGTYRQTEKMKLGEWLDEWYQNFCKGILKPYTCSSYEVIIRRHIKPALGAVRLSELNAGQVQKDGARAAQARVKP
jgi:hypothetical protein